MNPPKNSLLIKLEKAANELLEMRSKACNDISDLCAIKSHLGLDMSASLRDVRDELERVKFRSKRLESMSGTGYGGLVSSVLERSADQIRQSFDKLASERDELKSLVEKAETREKVLIKEHGEEVSRLTRDYEHMMDERNTLRSDIEAEQSGRMELRNRFGAQENETFGMFIDRLVKECGQARTELEAANARASRLEEELNDLISSSSRNVNLWREAYNDFKSRAEKAEAALATRPAPFPWPDEVVDQLARSILAVYGINGTPMVDAVRSALATLTPPSQAASVAETSDQAWTKRVKKIVRGRNETDGQGIRIGPVELTIETDHTVGHVQDAILSLLPTQAPSQAAPVRFDARSAAIAFANGDHERAEEQAAPVPPTSVGDSIWGDVVRVEYVDGGGEVCVGNQEPYWFPLVETAEEVADRIRRGLASLPQLRAVLPGGVTKEMVEAYKQAWTVKYENRFTLDECKLAGLNAALAVAPIRLLGPGEGVVTVRVCKEGQLFPKEAHWSDRGSGKSWWFNPGDGIATITQRDFRYILAADLDRVGLGK